MRKCLRIMMLGRKIQNHSQKEVLDTALHDVDNRVGFRVWYRVHDNLFDSVLTQTFRGISDRMWRVMCNKYFNN